MPNKKTKSPWVYFFGISTKPWEECSHLSVSSFLQPFQWLKKELLLLKPVLPPQTPPIRQEARKPPSLLCKTGQTRHRNWRLSVEISPAIALSLASLWAWACHQGHRLLKLIIMLPPKSVLENFYQLKRDPHTITLKVDISVPGQPLFWDCWFDPQLPASHVHPLCQLLHPLIGKHHHRRAWKLVQRQRRGSLLMIQGGCQQK